MRLRSVAILILTVAALAQGNMGLVPVPLQSVEGIHSGVRPQRVLLAPERRPIACGWKDSRV